MISAAITVDSPVPASFVVVCVTGHSKSVSLLRAARSRAKALGCAWKALYVLPNSSSSLGLRQLTQLVEKMGGSILSFAQPSAEKDVVQWLETNRSDLASFLVEETEKSQEYDRTAQSVLARALQTARKQETPVEILSYTGEPALRPQKLFRSQNVLSVAYALVSVAVAFFISWAAEALFAHSLYPVNSQAVSLIFMSACAFSAGRFGLLSGLAASAASFLIVDYYFTPPYRLFSIGSGGDMLNLFLFLFATITISLFTSRTRQQARNSTQHALNTQSLFTLYRLGTHATTRQEALEEFQKTLSDMLQAEVTFFVPHLRDAARIEPAFPMNEPLGESESLALEACWKDMKATGAATSSYNKIDWRFEPVIAPSGEIGVMGVRFRSNFTIDDMLRRLLNAIADQIAGVIELIDASRSQEAGRIRQEREKMHSMLLSSVSHDLRTPLASIIGALSIYRSQGAKLTAEKQKTLIDTALQEAERLDSFITNILDMTHLESGKIEFKPEWHEAQNLVQHVVRRMEHRLRGHKLVVNALPQRVEVYMDLMITAQALQNIIDNASKYTPAGTSIEINCRSGDEGFIFEVHDYGAGLPPEKLERVFDKYARLQKQDSQVAGTGLGLSIAKAMLEKQGGGITAANHPEQGALFAIYLPKWRTQESTKYVA